MSTSHPSTSDAGSADPARPIIDTTAVELAERPRPLVLPPVEDAPLPVLADWPGRLRVGQSGVIEHAQGQADDAAAPMSEVTPEVFAADVGAIRRALDAARNDDRNAPSLSVTPAGDIVIGEHGERPRPYSAVTPEVFAAPLATWTERRVAARCLPPGAVHTSSIPTWPAGSPEGWIVTTTTQTGDQFQYLLHWSARHGQYRATLISPKLEGHIGHDVTAHDVHLYTDGTMCITQQIGAPDLESAYGRSVLWCEGVAWSIRAGRPFPFNPDQAPLS